MAADGTAGLTRGVVAAEVPRAHVVERGTGRPLLLLHGWGASGALFGPVLDGLEPGRRLMVPDLPGFGATGQPPEAWSVHDYVTWTRTLLTRLDVDRCDVIGHSNGGRIAIALAASQPGLVTRLVLTGSSGIRPRRTLRDRVKVRWYKMLRTVERSAAVPGAVRREAGRRASARGSADYRAASGTMRGTLVRLVNEDLRDLLPRLTMPVLLIWGEGDTETPIADAQLMERLIPDSGLVVFEGAGHFAYVEQPARFSRIVDVFLRGDPA